MTDAPGTYTLLPVRTAKGGALTPAKALFLAALVVAATLTALYSRGPAVGASFTVDSTADAVDAAPGDGACADATGACTLRAAVQETNALPGPDTISLAWETYALAIPGTDEDAAATGDLDITDDLMLNGLVLISDGPSGSTITPQTVIDGERLDRLFDVIGGVTVEMSGLVIRNGDVTSAALTAGGGIQNLAGTLTINDSRITGNSSTGGGAS